MDMRRTTGSPERPRAGARARHLRGSTLSGALVLGVAGSIVGASALADDRAGIFPSASPATLADAGQARAVNPREHLAHADIEMHHTQDERRARSACSDRLVRAWLELGHVSDAYETYLLGQPPCP